MAPWLSALRSVSLGVAFAVLVSFVLLVGIGEARAQGLPSPAGSGWQWYPAVPYGEGEPWGEWSVPEAPEGRAWEVLAVTTPDAACPMVFVAQGPYLAQQPGDAAQVRCVSSWEPFETSPAPGAGAWARLVYVSPEAPEDPASSPAGDLSTVESHLELLAYAGFVVAAGLGYSGGRLR